MNSKDLILGEGSVSQFGIVYTTLTSVAVLLLGIIVFTTKQKNLIGYGITMEEDIILKVENLSKQQRLGLIGTGTISHDLNRFWAKIRGKEDPYLKKLGSQMIVLKKENPSMFILKILILR